MADQRRSHQPDTREGVDPTVAELAGLRAPDAEAYATEDEIDDLGEITPTRIYEGELESRAPDSDQPDETGAENLESLLEDEYREGETDDAGEAAEEGLTWIPPTDPPIIVDERGNAEIAAGFSTSAGDEPFDADHHGEALHAVDEVEARVLDALEANAATSEVVDGLTIDVEGGRAIIGGLVDDLEDEDAVVAVAASVPGIREAVSRLRIRGLAERPR
ncbi:MAG: hypothetical protein FIA92_00985 [Chloroflexi bacterium]|nr:hypothetical protein [Chloroflexota bacterium]